tara:strand:+ start:2627 stop:2848 length:222 start_codon:yes stop_codon:yes gene_type:complete
MSARRSHRSLGDLISTLVFSGMALLAFLTGFGVLEAGEPWRAAGTWFTGFLCFLGACRYPLARLFDLIAERLP